MSDRQKVIYALLASALFHVVLITFLAIVWATRHADEVVRAAMPQLSQLTVTIMPHPKLEPIVPVVKTAPVVHAAPTPMPDLDSDGLKTAAKAPPKPVFQSDSNMVAGSELPATGNLPLPSIAGEKQKFTDFANRASTAGKGQTQQAPGAARAASAMMPEQTPSAITRVVNTPAPAARATPQPEATPAPTPKPAPTAAPNTLAIGKATPTPTPAQQFARLTVPPSLRDNPTVAPQQKPQPKAGSQSEPATLRELNRTRVDGGITAHGPAGVDAVNTPYGRYHRTLSNLIGSRWNLYENEQPKDIGEVTILIRINPNGSVASTEIIGNHSIDGLADLSIRAIMDSKLPPVPDDLAPMLRNGKLEMPFIFTIYPSTHGTIGR